LFNITLIDFLFESEAYVGRNFSNR